jgi:chemotaxis protein MotB
MKKLEENKKENKERWLLTYSDMITLLMIFFIVLYTISSVNAEKFAKIANVLSKTFDGSQYAIGQYSGTSVVPGDLGNKGTSGVQNDLKEVEKQVNAFIKENNLQGKITDYINERGLVISLQDTLLFDLGSADVHLNEKDTVIKLGNMLKTLPNQIRVEGFTDNIPIYNNNFHSNWELSVIRATNVVKILVDEVKINPERISAVGYGEYRPIVPNDSDKNRQLNRRVDIVIMNVEYNKWEPKN